MANDFAMAGYQVAHDVHVLHEATRDLFHAWNCDTNAHGFVAGSYKEIAFVAEALTALAASINNASTTPSRSNPKWDLAASNRAATSQPIEF